MARPKIVLDAHRAQIEQWVQAGIKKEEIQRRLQTQENVTIGLSTLSAQLRLWDLRYKRPASVKTDALRLRVADLFHASPGLSDQSTVKLLVEEGFQISGTRALARLRKETGLYKRVDGDNKEAMEKEIRRAIHEEFGEAGSALPEDMATKELGAYLRSRYNLVGRDRIRRVAAEMNPEWIQKRKQKGLFPRPGPRTQQSHVLHKVESGVVSEVARSAAPSADLASDDSFREAVSQAEQSHSDSNAVHRRDYAALFAPQDFAPAWLDPGLTSGTCTDVTGAVGRFFKH